MNQQPDVHLPPPTFESSEPVIGQLENRPEQMPNPEIMPSAMINPTPSSGTVSGLPMMPSFQPIQPTPQAGISSLSVQGSVQQSKQHLEVQYIDKVRKIIATTRVDPYVRTKELNKTKAEFLDRRYGKKLKISDD
jgi:hypothetical protein